MMQKWFVWVSIGIVIVVTVIGAMYWHWGSDHQPWTVVGGDPRQGRDPIVGYGCSACHVIDGIGKATGRVGPKLQDIQAQIYLGGVLPNTSDNMVRWIINPQQFSPETAMPDLGVSEQDARDIAAYLYENS